ncbi:MAG: acyl-CoA thioesterase [Deltaproteobacteria bacterium]|nr:acyl-CoA thioesterase [Deltaproteobacteria bacterium]
MQPKPVKESQIEVTHIVQPAHINSLGTIFGGQVMAWIDLAAAICAERHTRQVCVTAAIDDLHFLAPVRAGDIVILHASVNYTHKTSLEIGVKVESENPLTGERRHTASAYLTFVALDEKRKPIEVPPILAETDKEKRRYREAEQRQKNRLKKREERKQYRS